MQNILDQIRKRALTIDNFCFKYSVGRTFAYAEIAAGRLHSIKIGRKRLVPDDSAENWFANFGANLTSTQVSVGEASRAA